MISFILPSSLNSLKSHRQHWVMMDRKNEVKMMVCHFPLPLLSVYFSLSLSLSLFVFLYISISEYFSRMSQFSMSSCSSVYFIDLLFVAFFLYINSLFTFECVMVFLALFPAFSIIILREKKSRLSFTVSISAYVSIISFVVLLTIAV